MGLQKTTAVLITCGAVGFLQSCLVVVFRNSEKEDGIKGQGRPWQLKFLRSFHAGLRGVLRGR